MKTRRSSFVGLCLLAAGLGGLPGCATVPGTGRSQIMLVSAGEAAAMGERQFEQMKREIPISHDPQINAMVDRVGRNIASVVDLPNADWEFVVFDKPDTANAFCLPGGKVGVYTGILDITQNEAGMATVIGHEVAHAVARHGSERLSQQLLVQMGGLALTQALHENSQLTQQLVLTAYGVGTTVGVILPYSRAQELEADHLGLLYMARAGYDPREALAFWQRFADYADQKGGQPPAFLSTHPVDEKRIEQIRKLMPEALKEYRQATGRSGGDHLDVPGLETHPVGIARGIADLDIAQVLKPTVLVGMGEGLGEVAIAEADLAHVEIADAVEGVARRRQRP